MDRNLYSPPSAPISDITKLAGTPVRPSQVSIAVLLLAVSLAQGTVTTSLLQPHYARNSQTGDSEATIREVRLFWRYAGLRRDT